MHDQTDRSDHGEQDKAGRKGAGGRVVNDEAEKVDADQRRQFRFAGMPLSERVGNLDDVQTTAGRQNHVDQNLETVGRQAWSKTRDDLSPKS